ncbi:motile sperm domain-containing protein 2-like [Macrosteles quadrilineatus]|uniref:motile sperm domain-containing protein 2-like n=1 Tax=Macrosteles quadrilineatus TaxID=74068 RepID=UPI0023E18F1C|nr:motile sperm domain-containing protein 2-like [Macrosteles quadrilineatus]XP_054275583.1 motile sperm domain-containing protein 2-like [Macrosteles quadrilineatus]
MEPSSYEIQELRSKFFEKLENEYGNTKAYFHPADLARVSNSDHWLKRFLVHHDMDMKDALTMLWETCDWRRENKVNDINENNVNKEYLEEGSLFLKNRDKDGKSLLILKCKKHVKGTKDFEELKRMVIYWFERAERKDRGEQITVFFDMAETGLNNIEMEYIKYLISLFKHYYPDFLNYILIFEIPWILNATFKIIKGWLPTKAVQKIKFVSKNTLKDYVEADQALTCWGGLDDYTYKFIPEVLDTPTVRLDEYKKKVHFADGSPMVEVAPFSDIDPDNPPASMSKLRVSPADTVVFSQDGADLTGTVNLMNISDKTLTYKIKTTSPDKFRVRPSAGVLHPSNSTTVCVVLQPGHAPYSLLKDKFLVMSFVLEEALTSTTELAELWKAADTKIVDQHRLRCALSGQTTSPAQNGTVYSSLAHGPPGDNEQKINQLLIGLNHLTHCYNKLEGDLRSLHMLTILLLLVVAGALMYIIYKLPQVSDTPPSTCYAPIPPPTDQDEL